MKFIKSITKKTGFVFSISSMVFTISNTIASLVTIGLLLPNEIGLWNSFIIAQPYIFIFQVGIFNGLNREIPYQIGKGNEEKAINLAKTALWICKILSYTSIILMFFLILYLYLVKQENIDTIICISVVLILSISQFYNNYLTVTFRSNSAFNKLSKINFYNSIINIGSLLFVYFYGFYGFMFRAIFVTLIQIVITHILRPLKIKSKFDKELTLELIKVGFPIFILGYLQGITNTFSRIIIFTFGGIVSVGLFSPALAVINIVKLIPSILSQYIYPKMTYNWGVNHDKHELWKWSRNSIMISFILSIPIVLVGWFLLPIIIKYYYPKYIKSIFSAQISIISFLFSGIYIGLNSLNTIKAFKSILAITILKLGAFWFLIYYFCIMINPVDGAAVGYLIADFIVSLVSFYIIYANLSK
jgi:O-antigen/teichoic acid export membrane protein